MSTKTEGKHVAVIEQIKAMALQPDPQIVLQDAENEVSKLRDDLSTLKQESKAAILALEEGVKRLEVQLPELDSPLEKATAGRVIKKVSSIKRKIIATSSKVNDEDARVSERTRAIEECSSLVAKLAHKYPYIRIKDIPWLEENKPIDSLNEYGFEFVPQVIPIPTNGHSAVFTTIKENGARNAWSCFEWPSCRETGNKNIKYVLRTFRNIFSKYLYLELQQTGHDSRHIIEYEFLGKIPPETKTAMREAEPDFTEKGGFLLMLADADLLHVSRRTESLSTETDPLIVGYHPDTPYRFWLIAAFDMTPVEQLIFDDALESFHKRRSNDS